MKDRVDALRVCSVLIGLVLLLGTGCVRDQSPKVLGTAYVRGGGVALRDQLGPSSTPVATLQGGEKVEVLDKRARWVQIRLAGGRTGWVHSRYLASPELFDQFRHLADENASLNSQGKAVIRRVINLHLEPGADTESFYRLTEGEAVEVLGHRVAERAGHGSGDSKNLGESGEEDATQIQVTGHEDWILIRAAGRKTGWVSESSLDMDPPIEIARYNEGLRVRAWFILYQEQDQGETHPWYLWATVHPRAGLPFDYDEIRVFVWNPNKSRYETSYRERNLIGFYPVKVSTMDTPGGPAPSFSLELEDAAGKRFRKNYVMSGRLVKTQS